MSKVSEFKEALNLADDVSEYDIPSVLTALIISATHDTNPPSTLRNIHRAVTETGFQSSLEPLDLVPTLLGSTDPEADELLSLIGECGSPKEILLACEESIEILALKLGSIEEEEEEDTGRSPTNKINAVMELYAAALPRLKLKRKSTENTLKPILNFKSVITHCAHLSSKEECRGILRCGTNLATGSISWLGSLPSIEQQELNACNGILKAFLLFLMEDLSGYMDTQISLRIFHQVYPRLRIPESLSDNWKNGEDAIQDAMVILLKLGYNPIETPPNPNMVHVILFAHADMTKVDPLKTLQVFLPLLLSAIQSNANLDEVLSILIFTLHEIQNNASQTNINLDERIVIPLTSILPTLASTHPDPTIRHITYRALSLSISLASPQLRLHILKDLTSSSDNTTPQQQQLQIAAIGLIKEVLLECLQNTSTNLAKLFLSESIFFPTFGPILFRPNPPELFSNPTQLSKEKFIDSSEPTRLTECLTLYYLLLVRDTSNKSGIRNKDIRKSIDGSLITPLQRQLSHWNSSSRNLQSVQDHSFSLLALDMGITRIQKAISDLGN